jgi:hypothetical protein
MVNKVYLLVMKLGSDYVSLSFTTETEVVSPGSASVILGNG